MDDTDDLESLARRLEAAPDYRVLRRLHPRPINEDADDRPIRLGIVLDTETTGLDPRRHEMIELALLPGADLAESLSRHCPSVGTVTLPVGDDGVAKILLTHAELTRADLLVMGAYAHSRIHELVFGGVTRDMLAGADRPVLLSF